MVDAFSEKSPPYLTFHAAFRAVSGVLSPHDRSDPCPNGFVLYRLLRLRPQRKDRRSKMLFSVRSLFECAALCAFAQSIKRMRCAVCFLLALCLLLTLWTAAGQALPLISLSAADWGTNVFAGDYGSMPAQVSIARMTVACAFQSKHRLTTD